MIKRILSQVVLERAEQFPVLTLTGPRQSGKTTLVRECFPNHTYVNLEDPETRTLAESDYHRFFSIYRAPLIIDEIQRVPALASAIQVLVDEKRQEKGQFILTGSHQPKLRETVTQSLAGRSAFLKLLPLTIQELKSAKPKLDLSPDALILRGCMPELAASSIPPDIYYKNYIQSYVEKDVRLIANIRNTSAFLRFLVLLAGRVGQILNLNSLACDVGVSHTTLSEWIDVLEASFIVFRLPPHFANIGKRLIRSPKLYFTETGLAASLLGLKTADQVSREPLRGNLFENLIVGELLKRKLNSDEDGELFFFRTSDGLEVDVLRQTPDGLQPIEIKSAMTWSGNLASGLNRYCKTVSRAPSPLLVYAGTTIPSVDGGLASMNYLDFV